VAAAVDFHFDDVAGDGDRRARGRAGQDDVAGFEGDQLREVGDQPSEAEKQVGGGVLLDEFAVEPGPQPQGRRVDAGRGQDRRPERGEAVAALGAQVAALVGVPQVVDAEVVGRGDAADVRPALFGGDAAGGAADDQRGSGS
jgi:hypothetical protein